MTLLIIWIETCLDLVNIRFYIQYHSITIKKYFLAMFNNRLGYYILVTTINEGTSGTESYRRMNSLCSYYSDYKSRHVHIALKSQIYNNQFYNFSRTTNEAEFKKIKYRERGQQRVCKSAVLPVTKE